MNSGQGSKGSMSLSWLIANVGGPSSKRRRLNGSCPISTVVQSRGVGRSLKFNNGNIKTLCSSPGVDLSQSTNWLFWSLLGSCRYFFAQEWKVISFLVEVGNRWVHCMPLRKNTYSGGLVKKLGAGRAMLLDKKLIKSFWNCGLGGSMWRLTITSPSS